MQDTRKGWPHGLALLLFALSGLAAAAPLAGTPPDTMPLIYAGFVGLWFARRFLPGLPVLPGWLFVPIFVVTGWLTESLAWASDWLAGRAIPVTFHPQLGVDLVLATGFYGGLGLGWALLSRWFRFTLWQVFSLAGIYGVLVEQDGTVAQQIMAGFATDPGGAALMALYVFAVYGAFSALPFLLIGPRPGRSQHWARLPLALIAMLVLPRLGMAVILGLWALLGGVPEARSALEFPFW